MTADDEPLEDRAEDLFEDAPCGYLTTRPDGTIVRVNRTFETLTGYRREELLGSRRFQDLLTAGGRIYHETHVVPLLRMQGSVREIALDLVLADGTRLPALVNALLRRDPGGQPSLIRTTVFDASDRRRYEQELLRLRHREQEIAQLLQRSLLAGELPSAPGLDVGVAYRPGVSGLEVGGDWYDAFWLEEGRTVALVVGDVVGRGLGAAATMGQLRSAVRALASTGLAPGQLLGTLDNYVQRHCLGEMATVAYGELDLGTRRLRYACAGHPPPAIAQPAQRPVLAWEGRSPPLGARLSGSGPRPQAAQALSAGAAVLLYSDGLVERRSRPMAEGLEALLDVVASHPRAAAPALATTLARDLRDAGEADDVCVLVARLGGPDGDGARGR